MMIPEQFVPFLDSTMRWARDATLSHPVFRTYELFRVRCAHQTAGRGRRGRRWFDEAGEALMMTLAIRRGSAVDPGDRNPGTLALRAGVAVAEALVATVRDASSFAIKWPNDILYKERKIAGILIEADPRWFYIGIGINAFSPETGSRQRATWLEADRTGETLQPASILEAVPKVPAATLIDHFDRSFPTYLHGDSWRSVLSDHLAWRNQLVRITSPAEEGGFDHFGVFEGIDRDGAAILRNGTERTRRVTGTMRRLVTPNRS